MNTTIPKLPSLIAASVAASVIAFSPANSAVNKTFSTRGDMSNEDVHAVMNMREKQDALFESLQSANKRMGNAILASTLGVILDGSAVAMGAVKNSRQIRDDMKFREELEKEDLSSLEAKFAQSVKETCDAEKAKNPTETIKDTEGNETAAELECSAETEQKRIDALVTEEEKREAIIEFLAKKNEGGAEFAQTANWIRMGAAAGGAIASGVSIGVINNAVKDLEEANQRAKAYEQAISEVSKAALQARMESRSNNPLAELSKCKGDVDMSRQVRNLKTARTVQIVGTVASGLGAAASGVQNVGAVGEQRALNVGSNAASAVGAAASGVGIGVVASNRKAVRGEIKKITDCMEWLYWDENGHEYATVIPAAPAPITPPAPPPVEPVTPAPTTPPAAGGGGLGLGDLSQDPNFQNPPNPPVAEIVNVEVTSVAELQAACFRATVTASCDMVRATYNGVPVLSLTWGGTGADYQGAADSTIEDICLQVAQLHCWSPFDLSGQTLVPGGHTLFTNGPEHCYLFPAFTRNGVAFCSAKKASVNMLPGYSPSVCAWRGGRCDRQITNFYAGPTII